MSFDLRVTFTGLMGFVKNADESAYPPMCVLLVDGKDPRRAVDGSVLCRHRSFIRFPIDNVENTGNSVESFGLWYLDRQRVYFRVYEEEDNVGGLTLKNKDFGDVPHPEKPDPADEADKESLTWLLDIERLFPNFSLDGRALSVIPSGDVDVAAQIVLDRGTLATRSFANAVWSCDQTLSDKPYRQVFAHEIDLVIPGLAGGRVIAVDFNDSARRRVLDLASLPPDAQGEVRIEVVTVCEKNPLQWPTEDSPIADQDTKWFFELLDPDVRQSLRKILGDRDLPIPRPVEAFNEEGLGTPGTGNCIPVSLASSKYSLPMLEQAKLPSKAQDGGA